MATDTPIVTVLRNSVVYSKIQPWILDIDIGKDVFTVL